MKRKIIVTSSLVLGIIISSIIDRSIGFEKGYIAISFAAILSAYWTVEFLIDLVYYYWFYEQDFNLFIAEKVNKTNLTYDDIIQRIDFYFKEFKRTRLKGKFYGYMKLFFAMGLFIFLVTCLFV